MEGIDKICPCCGRPMAGLAFKGFSYAEVLSKAGMTHSVGDMVINFTKLVFTKAGKPVKLTRSEWKYLAVIVSFQGETASRETMYQMVAGLNGGTTRTVDTFVALLRHKLGRYIETVQGMGYRWTTEIKPKVKAEPAPAPVVAAEPIPEKPKAVVVPPVKKVKPPMGIIPSRESPVRIYKVKDLYVPWNQTDQTPELIAQYREMRGELPPFLAIPAGKLIFKLEGVSVCWDGQSKFPEGVVMYLEEYGRLPVITNQSTPTKKRVAA